MSVRVPALISACCWLLHAPTLALAAGTRTTPGFSEDTPLNLPADQPRQLETVGGGGSGLVRTFVGLAVVIGVIYGVAWLLRQMKASREERSTGYGLQHAATIALGPNRSLHLVRAGSELVLVGSAEQGVVPIRTYSEAEALELGLLAPPAEDGRPALGGGGAPAAVGARAATGLTALVDRVRDLTVRK